MSAHDRLLLPAADGISAAAPAAAGICDDRAAAAVELPNAELTGAELPDAAWWVAVTTLPEVGPSRLRVLMASGAGRQVWARLVDGSIVDDREVAAALGSRRPAIVAGWRSAAGRTSVAELWRRHRGLGVAIHGDASFPEAFVDDPEPPGVLFSTGRSDPTAVLDGPRVGVVGTRRASRYGLDVAYELGRDLALAGVRVVSGLALGIDGAAHRGALAAARAAGSDRVGPPVGVVAGGLDVVYPPRHADLFRQVAEAGVLLSEAPLGQRPQRWRFPARNRLIAALSDVLVVVESPSRGGSLLTAAEMADRGRTVCAVPGSVRAPSAAGTLQLLVDGAQPCRGADDVLLELHLQPGGRRGPAGARVAPPPADQAVLEALGWAPATLEELAVRSGLALVDLAASLTRLEAEGWVVHTAGWYERSARPEAGRAR